MAAYLIADVRVTDPAGFGKYRQMVPATIDRYGGRFLVRGGEVVTLEGEWQPERIVVIEFESVERAKQWWASEEYREAKELRHKSATARLIVVEGV